MRYLILSFLLFLLPLCHQTHAQDAVTSTLDSLAKEGRQLLDSGNFQVGREVLESGKTIAQEAGLMDRVYGFENSIVETLWRTNQMDRAKSRAKTLLGAIQDDKLTWNNESTSSKELEIAATYHNLGIIYDLSSNVDSALYFLNKALEIRGAILPFYHEKTASTLHNIGIVYHVMGLYDQAAENYEQSLDIKRKIFGEDHVQVASTYSALGGLYENKGLFHIALDYQRRSMAIRKEIFGSEHFLIGQNLNNIGVVYINLREKEKALDYFRQSLQVKSINRNKLNGTYNNIGFTYENFGQYDSALHFYLIAKDEIIKNADQGSLQYANQLKNIGYAYLNLGQLSEGLKFLDLAAKRYHEGGYVRHPYVGLLYQGYSKIFQRKEEYDSALHYVQRALVANSMDFNDSVDYLKNPLFVEALDPILAIKLLSSKALLMERVFGDEAHISNLNIFALQDSIFRHYRQNNLNFEDKLSLNSAIHQASAIAISNLLDLYKNTGNRNYINTILRYSEGSKASTLREEWSTSSVLKLVPKEISSEQSKVKGEVSYYESKIKAAAANKSSIDQEQFEQWEDRLFTAKRTRDSIQSVLRSDYQNYYEIIYENKAHTIEEIQSGLAASSALVEYIINEECQAAIVITKDDVKVYTLGDVNQLSQQIDAYRKLVSGKEQHSSHKYQELVTKSYLLYQAIFLPFQDFLNQGQIQNIIIVPDGGLHYLPFETLLTAPAQESNGSYHRLGYLLNEYNINYQYSTSFAFKDLKKDRVNASSFIGFAPVFEGVSEITNQEILTRAGEVPLHWNAQEVSDITQILKHSRKFEKEEATEFAFKSNATNASIIHLATHAFVDEEDHMKSKIVFSNSRDTLEDDILYAFEIYNMHLNADLVTLSACNTGYGELAVGEGTMSLARAFSYAGVPSVVMSHWEVDDKITAQLMTLFYKNLKEGMKKDQALRQAKLQLMAENDPAVSNPYYWGSFVVIGDTSPINTNSYFWYWLLGGAGLVLIFAFAKFSRK